MTTETILEYFTQNLEKVAIINDVLPRKAAGRDAVAD